MFKSRHFFAPLAFVNALISPGLADDSTVISQRPSLPTRATIFADQSGPMACAVSTAVAYIACTRSRQIIELTMPDGKPRRSATLPFSPGALAYDGLRNRIYVTGNGTPEFEAFDASTLQAIKHVALPARCQPTVLAIDARTATAYVGDRRRSITAIDLAKLQVVRSIRVQGTTTAILPVTSGLLVTLGSGLDLDVGLSPNVVGKVLLIDRQFRIHEVYQWQGTTIDSAVVDPSGQRLYCLLDRGEALLLQRSATPKGDTWTITAHSYAPETSMSAMFDRRTGDIIVSCPTGETCILDGATLQLKATTIADGSGLGACWSDPAHPTSYALIPGFASSSVSFVQIPGKNETRDVSSPETLNTCFAPLSQESDGLAFVTLAYGAAYIPTGSSKSVVILDKQLHFNFKIDLQFHATEIAASTDCTQLAILDASSQQLAITSLAQRSVVKVVSLPFTPQRNGMVFDSASDTVFIPDQNTPTLHRISVITGKLGSDIVLAGLTSRIQYCPQLKQIALIVQQSQKPETANNQVDEVELIDPASGQSPEIIDCGSEEIAAVAASENALFILSADAKVSSFDKNQFWRRSFGPVQPFPQEGDANRAVDLSWDPTSSNLYSLTGGLNGQFLTRLDPTTLQPAATIYVGYADRIGIRSNIAGNGSEIMMPSTNKVICVQCPSS